ncbi:CGNR zinc finger domain-containing protein [Actinosynnema sp. ALI-1.44]|uniref:CGNR zinc finger domain-containing protein n=1 Tax=Actinosynnema sp. ALI-1.44 TaxID=1933779 RepID=UPI00143CCF3A
MDSAVPGVHHKQNNEQGNVSRAPQPLRRGCSEPGRGPGQHTPEDGRGAGAPLHSGRTGAGTPGRQRYCTHTCANRDAVRRHRARTTPVRGR